MSGGISDCFQNNATPHQPDAGGAASATGAAPPLAPPPPQFTSSVPAKDASTPQVVHGVQTPSTAVNYNHCTINHNYYGTTGSNSSAASRGASGATSPAHQTASSAGEVRRPRSAACVPRIATASPSPASLLCSQSDAEQSVRSRAVRIPSPFALINRVRVLQAAPRAMYDMATKVAAARLRARKGSTGCGTLDDFVAGLRERSEDVTSGGSGLGESACAELPRARQRTREPEAACKSERRDVVQQTRAVGLVSHDVQTKIGRIRPDQAGVDQLSAMVTAQQQAMGALIIASSESDGGSSVDSDALHLDSPPPPPSEYVEILVQTSDGDKQPCRVELDTPLGGTLLWRESDGRLWTDGDRVGEQQTPRQLGPSISVLQSFKPQAGGAGDADANAVLVHRILALKNDPFVLLSLSGTQLRRATASDDDLRRAHKFLAVRVHPDKLPGCPDANPAMQALNDALKKGLDRASGAPEAPQSSAAGSGSDDGSDDGGAPSGSSSRSSSVSSSRSSSSSSRSSSSSSRSMRDDENEQQQQQQQQQTAAQQGSTAASRRSAEFQERQQQYVRAPTIAESGMEPWEKPHSHNLPPTHRHNRVTVAQLETSEVPDFGTPLRVKVREVVDGKAAIRTGTDPVPLRPTPDNTLLIEAGCASQKTRQLLFTWLKFELQNNPDLPVLFVTTRKTHADDLHATVKGLEEIGFVTNYLDAKNSAVNYLNESKQSFLAHAKRLIVSEQSLGSVNCELYKGGAVIMDEVRSLASIPGGKTLERPEFQIQSVLRCLCTNAKYRIAMDADVSADGAVRDWLCVVAGHFDVLHVQLRRAKLHRDLPYGFTESKRDVWIMRTRLRLALFGARQSREAAMAGEKGQRLKQAALAVIGAQLRPARRSEEPRAAGRLKLPWRRAAGDARDAPVDWKPVQVGLLKREGGGLSIGQSAVFWLTKKDFSQQIERVFVICASQKQAMSVTDQADKIGACLATDEGFYKGKGSNEKKKREHFKDTSRVWLWADVVVATSTLSVGVNVQVHFACCFLYTMATAHAGTLRELFQGIVRVGRNLNDPLRDERIFTLISGSSPSLEFDSTPQPERHAVLLAARLSKAKCGAEGAAHAKREADKRLGIEGQEFNAAEATLDLAMLSLLAWNDLEAEDNAGGRHAVKMMELCKLPTRKWEPMMMADLSHDEEAKLARLERDLQMRGESTRPLTADAAVSDMSPAEQYDWLCDDLESAAAATAADDKPLAWHRSQFLLDQAALLDQARPEYDARESVRAEIYRVIRLLTAQNCMCDETVWPADGEEFAKLSRTFDRLEMRAMLTHLPPGELKAVHEWQRRDGKTGHSAVVTPAHEMHSLLTSFAVALNVPITSLLMGYTFKPTCTAAANGLHSGAVCHATACDGSCHMWLRLNNRLRAKVGTPQDETKRKLLLNLAKRMGATQPNGSTLHGASMPVAIVKAVSDGVLALNAPNASCYGGPGEKKVMLAPNKRCLQVAEPWPVCDESAGMIGAIMVPLLHPETKQLLYVRADVWNERFAQLTSALPSPDPYAALLSDAEEEDGNDEMSEAGDGTGAGAAAEPSGNVQRVGYNPWQKEFQVDMKRLAGMIETLECERPAVDTGIRAIDARQVELLQATQGAAGGAKSVTVLLVHPDEPSVLLVQETRHPSGEPWRGVVVMLNPLGGKLDRLRGDNSLMDAAARLSREQTAGQLSKKAQRSLLYGKGVLGAYDATTSAFVYVHRLENPQDIFLPNKVISMRWEPLDSLLSEEWCREHCNPLCQSELAVARPLLQALQSQSGAAAGAGPSRAAASDICAMAREMRELEAQRKALTRHHGLLAVAQGMQARCDGQIMHAGADGYVALHDAYALHGVNGRRWVRSDIVQTPEAGAWQPRSATLQGGHSDLRAVCCGLKAHDIDCENGDYRLIASGAAQISRLALVPSVSDYIEHRDEHLKEICALHGCEKGVAKRLPNIVGNNGTYYTWLRNNDLEPQPTSAFNGKRCKTFLPEDKCRSGEPNMTRELRALRDVVSEHPRYTAQVAAKREQLERRDGGPQSRHATSLWSNIVQTWEDTVLGIVDETLFGLGWDVWALVFDGVMVAPSAACTEPDLKTAMGKAQVACEQRGWRIVLAEKPLRGLQDETPKTIVKARAALTNWAVRQALAASGK